MMMPLGEDFYRRRVAAIQAALDEDWQGMLLSTTQNVVYASGFVHSPSERPIGLYIPKTGEPVLFVPLLEQENAADTWITDIRTYFEFPAEVPPFQWMVEQIGGCDIAVDNIQMTMSEVDTLESYDFFDCLPTTELVNEMRWQKQPEEITCIEAAAHYADFCLEYVRDHAADIIQQGGTELDILEACMGATIKKMRDEIGWKYGRRLLNVTGTVHSGPRAALPHGEPMARQPEAGDTLIAGIGAMVGGYHAESGATFIVGEPSDDQMHCLQAAVDCDQAAVDALKAGNTCAQVNEAALAVLRERGFGDAIRHRIGHGMGLEGHEAPWLAPGDQTMLKPKMVFSNEPGIYRPGVDGYRTINTMIVTNRDARVVSRFLAENPPEQRIIDI